MLFALQFAVTKAGEACLKQNIRFYEPIQTEIELAVENGEVEVEMPIPKL